jgi:cyclase
MSASGDLRLHRIDEGVFLYRGYFSNSAVVTGPEGVVVVDTQVSLGAAGRLRETIRGVSAAPVRVVVNTHYHGDHTGGNALFSEAEIVATTACGRFTVERDRERFEYAETFGLPFQEIPPVAPATRTFEGALALDVGGEPIEVLQLGRAETPDACVVHWPSRGVIACGDGVATCDYPFLGVPFLDEGLRDDGQWLGFLAHLRRLRPRVLLPGHGPPLVGEAVIAARLDLLSTLLTSLLDVTREELARGGSPSEIVERADRRLRHYHRRRDLRQYTVSQRFALYRCLNNMMPDRAGRGWWHDLRPSVLKVATRARGEQLLAGSASGDVAALASRARRLARRDRPAALALVAAFRRASPGDPRGAGLESELFLDGARSVRPTVDATEYVAAALRAAREALALDPAEPAALLTLGCVEVFGGMVLAQPMAAAIARIEVALRSDRLPRAQRRKGEFFLGKAHQMEGDGAAADGHFRRALPGWMRPLYPLLRARLRRYP